MPGLLTDAERSEALAKLPDWRLADGQDAISRTFAFKSFSAAFGWMTRVALVAEKMDHHPDWTNTYDKVVVTLASHDVGGVSARDIRLAEAMDRLFRG